MKTVTLNSIFDIQYGNQFDLNKLDIVSENGINFVSRSSQNLGVTALVSLIDDIEPYESGLITVTLGGTYLLSSFVQQKPFYTGQNIKILSPKRPMSFNEKIYYCTIIEANRYRYTTHGREANQTLDTLIVPEYPHLNIDNLQVEKPSNKNIFNQKLELNTKNRKSFRYDEIFDIKKGYYNKKPDHIDIGNIPFIGATEYNNGVTDYFTQEEIENFNKAEGSSFDDIEKKIFKGNAITVSNNGSVGYAFYQSKDFTCSHDVNPLYLKNKVLNIYIAMFLITLIELEQYRRAYGRKRRPNRMPDSIIKLPVDKNNDPDREFMEKHIKSLPYSASL